MKKTTNKSSLKTALLSLKEKYLTKRSKIIVSTVIGILFLVWAGLSVKSYINPPVIAFYGMEKNTTAKLQQVLTDELQSKNIKHKFVEYDSRETLEKQIKNQNPSIIFTLSGAPVNVAVKHASSKAAVSSELLQEMTSTMRQTAVYNKSSKKVKAVPVLCSNLEFDIHTAAFKSTKINGIKTMDDIVKFNNAKKADYTYPVVFAGKDSGLFLDILGALTEALDGPESYKKAAEEIKKSADKKFNAIELADKLAGSYNGSLYSGVNYLKQLRENKLLTNDVFSLSQNDVNVFLKSNLSVTTMMSLEQHRQMETGVASRFSSIYVPSEHTSASRTFTAPVVCAVPLKNNKNINLLINTLTTDKMQETLSRATGLAPANAHCRTPDKQADDARYWIAATNAPFAGLSREADLSKKQKDALAAELISKIRN